MPCSWIHNQYLKNQITHLSNVMKVHLFYVIRYISIQHKNCTKHNHSNNTSKRKSVVAVVVVIIIIMAQPNFSSKLSFFWKIVGVAIVSGGGVNTYGARGPLKLSPNLLTQEAAGEGAQVTSNLDCNETLRNDTRLRPQLPPLQPMNWTRNFPVKWGAC